MAVRFEVIGEDGNRKTVRFTQTAEEVSRLFGKVRRDISKDMVMHGFRPGKIPREIVDKRFGNLITVEVADMIRQELTSELLSDQDWILGDQDPDGEIQLPVDGDDYVFELKFALFETPEPGDYTGVEISMPSADLEKMIDDSLQSFREQLVDFSTVERPATLNDLVMLEAIPAGSGEDEDPRSIPVRIGEDQIGPGFDDLLRDVSAGDEFMARMESTEDGRPGADPHRFRVIEVRESILPELNDDLAKKVADVDTLTELRHRMGENIEKRHKDEMAYLRERQALDAILEKNQFDPPVYMVENLSSDLLARLEEDEPSDETRKAVKEMAAKKVREFLLLRAIAVKEGMNVSEEDIDKEKNHDESRGSVLDRLRNRMAVEHVISHATSTEMDPKEADTGEDSGQPQPGWKWVIVPETEAVETSSVPAGGKEG
jgi:trigger factor